MQHTSFGEGAYLQIPLGYGFFLHAELQVLHFPGEGEREWSVTLRLASHLQAAIAHGPPLHNKKLRRNAIFYIKTALQKLNIKIQGARQLSKPTHSEHLPSCKVQAPKPTVPAVLFLSQHNCCSLTPGSWKQWSHKQFSLFYLDPVISQRSTRQFLCQTQMVHTKYSRGIKASAFLAEGEQCFVLPQRGNGELPCQKNLQRLHRSTTHKSA